MAQRIQGEGSVYWENAHKRWAASAVTGRDGRGRVLRKFFYGPRSDDSKGAKRGVVDRLDALARNPKMLHGKIFAQYARKYIENPELRTSTRATLACGYQHIEDTSLDRKRITDITSRGVRAFLDGY